MTDSEQQQLLDFSRDSVRLIQRAWWHALAWGCVGTFIWTMFCLWVFR